MKTLRSEERKHTRLKDYDYSQEGWYFVTICTQNREEIFGEVINDEMMLNEYGEIVKRQWLWLAKQYPYVELDEFIVMLNHFHGIIVINNVGTGRDLSLPKIKSLSELIGAFKTTSSKKINQIQDEFLFRWQRSFHDHIIRSHESLDKILEYIYYNACKWDLDENNKINFLTT